MGAFVVSKDAAESDFDARDHIRVSRLSVGTGTSLSLAMAAHKARESAAQIPASGELLLRVVGGAYLGIERG